MKRYQHMHLMYGDQPGWLSIVGQCPGQALCPLRRGGGRGRGRADCGHGHYFHARSRRRFGICFRCHLGAVRLPVRRARPAPDSGAHDQPGLVGHHLPRRADRVRHPICPNWAPTPVRCPTAPSSSATTWCACSRPGMAGSTPPAGPSWAHCWRTKSATSNTATGYARWPCPRSARRCRPRCSATSAPWPPPCRPRCRGCGAVADAALARDGTRGRCVCGPGAAAPACTDQAFRRCLVQARGSRGWRCRNAALDAGFDGLSVDPPGHRRAHPAAVGGRR